MGDRQVPRQPAGTSAGGEFKAFKSDGAAGGVKASLAQPTGADEAGAMWAMVNAVRLSSRVPSFEERDALCRFHAVPSGNLPFDDFVDEPGPTQPGDWLIVRGEAIRVVAIESGTVFAADLRHGRTGAMFPVVGDVVIREYQGDFVEGLRGESRAKRVSDRTVRGSAAYAEQMRGTVVAARDGVVYDHPNCESTYGSPRYGERIGVIEQHGRTWSMTFEDGSVIVGSASKRDLLVSVARRRREWSRETT